MVAEVELGTGLVVTANVAGFQAPPPAIVAFPGTTTAGLVLERAMIAEVPEATGPVRNAFPVAGVPPVTLLGLTSRCQRAGGSTVTAAVFASKTPRWAEIVTGVDVATGWVMT